jgi:hypothetical protein
MKSRVLSDSSERKSTGEGGVVIEFWSRDCLRVLGVHLDPRKAQIVGWSPALGERVARRLRRTA